MSISDKTRKILWGRSGNRCAICKKELVVDATPFDAEAVIGDECHIVSPKAGGPRHDPNYAVSGLDEYDNLILLCRVHHKMVDDQSASYPRDKLAQIKSEHETLVAKQLSADAKEPSPLRRRRVKQSIPSYLVRMNTGKQLLDLIIGVYGYVMDHDELESELEVELISGFLQAIRDWGDFGDDFEPSDRVRVGFELTRSIKELEQSGFIVFAGLEVQLLEGGIQSRASNFPVAHIEVLRERSNRIIRVNPGQAQTEDGEACKDTSPQ